MNPPTHTQSDALEGCPWSDATGAMVNGATALEGCPWSDANGATALPLDGAMPMARQNWRDAKAS